MYQKFTQLLLVMSVLLAMTNTTLGQTQQTITLPKGVKLKTIDYKFADYVAVGYMIKKQFADGCPVTFFDKQTQDTIISGKYFTEGITACIDGVWKQKTENGNTRAKGIFKITNSANNFGVTTKPKEGNALKIETKDIYLYQGFHGNYPAVLKKENNRNYLLTVDYYDMAGKIRTWTIEKELIDKYGWFDIEDLIYHTNSIVIQFGNGDIFAGKVDNFKTEDNLISHKFREGIWTRTTGDFDKEELIKLPDNNYQYKAIYSKRKQDNQFTQIEIPVNKSLVDKYGYWTVGDYIYNAPEVKYTYKNGDIFTGKQICKKDTINHSVNSQFTQGELKYATGEVFQGDLSGEWYLGVPVSGTMTFKDGTTEQGNWLAKYGLTQKDKDKIEQEKSITEKLKIAREAEKKYRKEQYDKAIEEAGRFLDKDDVENAKIAYSNALNFKPQNLDSWEEDTEKSIESRIESTEERLLRTQEREKKEKEMISKYGEHWGKLIINKEYVIGMTKAMVSENINIKNEFLELYKVTKSVKNGQYIETWEFDIDKMYFLATMHGIYIEPSQKHIVARKLFDDAKLPGILEFTNDKITKVKKL